LALLSAAASLEEGLAEKSILDSILEIMKPLLWLLLIFASSTTVAQNGYVVLTNDSVLVGYIRPVFLDGQSGLEVWKTKSDKKPRRILKLLVTEYAIKQDTVRVLHNFNVTPPVNGAENYYEFLDARILSRGKVNLMEIVLTRYDHRTATGVAAGALVGAYSSSHPTYLLEDPRTGYITALSRDDEKYHETLFDFFPRQYVVKYEEVNGLLKYKNIPALVKYYNLKSR
jgi:hypothetical protein